MLDQALRMLTDHHIHRTASRELPRNFADYLVYVHLHEPMPVANIHERWWRTWSEMNENEPEEIAHLILAL